MEEQQLLTEDQVIEGVRHFLEQKGRTVCRRVVHCADARRREHGEDLVFRLENERGNGNRYCIEAKGNLRADGTPMRSRWSTNFRWAISQIILRMEVDPRRYNYIYGIAVPDSEAETCIRMIRSNWALRHLKLRLYGAYWEDGQLTAKEYLPRDIYSTPSAGKQ